MTTVAIPSATENRERALTAITRLPPFSPVLNKLIASLNDDNVSIAELGDLIEKDTVLAGNVLRLVNSALYARRGTVSSVRHGVAIMGLAKLRNVTLSLALARMWNQQKWPAGWSTARLNLHGVASAILADQLCLELPVDYPEGGFTAGLLQNVGMLLIALGMPDAFDRVHEVYVQGATSLAECERQVLGLDHSELSSATLRHWNLPEPIIKAVEQHHGPHPNTPNGVSLGWVVAVADRMAEQQGLTAQDWHRSAEGIPADTLAEIGLADKAASIITNFDAEFQAIKGFFE